ncbi:MAG: ABC transporter substrate-binding protein, partial [Planctomycetota bacterium]
MFERPLISAVKILLLAAITVLLLFVFLAHNETQGKVIETAKRVDEVRDAVAQIRRRLDHGVPASTGGQPAAPAAEQTGPRKPGYTVILSPEADPPRAPDDQIDFDAEYRTATLGEPKGLNQYTSDRDQTVATLFGHYVYAPLAYRHESNKDRFKPGLAERVELSPDRLEHYIWIRPGVEWHRPALDLTDSKYAWMRGRHEVTAEDLVFALDMIRDEQADTDAIRATFLDIQDYEAVDKHTLHVRWRKPSFYATGTLLGDLQPFPKWIYTREENGTPIDATSLAQRFASHWFNKSMCGYGPYRFREYRQSDYVLLERNEDFWGRRPAYKTIRYKLSLVEDETRYNLFMSYDPGGIRQQVGYPISSARLKRDVYD